MLSRRHAITGVVALAVAISVPNLAEAAKSTKGSSGVLVTPRLDKRFSAVDGPPHYLCPTGEPYIQFSLAGFMSDDGWPYKTAANAEMALVEEWLKQFWTYADAGPKQPRLYWRQRPMIEWEDRDSGGLFMIWSRQVLTSKPELPESEQRALGIIA